MAVNGTAGIDYHIGPEVPEHLRQDSRVNAGRWAGKHWEMDAGLPQGIRHAQRFVPWHSHGAVWRRIQDDVGSGQPRQGTEE